MSDSLDRANKELRVAGLFDKDSDYGGMLGHAVMRLLKIHVKEGHSGFSNSMAVDIFRRLALGEVLTPITNNPDEWSNVTDMGNPNIPMWQNKRDCAHFSNDGGKTYYHVDKHKKMITAVEWKQ